MNKEPLDKFKTQTGSLQSMGRGKGSLGVIETVQTAREMKLLLLLLLLLV